MSNRPGPLGQRIAAEIRAELGRQHSSRRWLAEQIGQNHVTVSRWVNGDGPMSFDAFDDICRALGISVADLLARVGQQQDVVPSPRPRRSKRGSVTAEIESATDNAPSPGRDTRGHVEETRIPVAA